MLVDEVLKKNLIQGDHFSNHYPSFLASQESEVPVFRIKKRQPAEKIQTFEENNNKKAVIPLKESKINGDNNNQNLQFWYESPKQIPAKTHKKHPESFLQDFEEHSGFFETERTRLEEPEKEEIKNYFQTNSFFSTTHKIQSKRRKPFRNLGKPEKSKDSLAKKEKIQTNSVSFLSEQSQSRDQIKENSKDSSEKKLEKPEKNNDSFEKKLDRPPQVQLEKALNVQPPKIPPPEVKTMPNQASFGLFQNPPTGPIIPQGQQPPLKPKESISNSVQNMVLPQNNPNLVPPQNNPNIVLPPNNPNLVPPQNNPNIVLPQNNPNITIPQNNPNIAIPQNNPNIAIPQNNPNIVPPQNNPIIAIPQNNPMLLEMDPPKQQNPIPKVPQIKKPQPEEEKKIDNNPPVPALVSHEQIFLKNLQNTAKVQKDFATIANKVPTSAQDDIEGEIKKGIGHLFGSSLLRLFETAEEFIKLYEKYRGNEDIIIFFASQFVKITLAGQVDNCISDKETMRNRLGRIAILLHFINLHCSCLIDFVIGLITSEIPLLIPKDDEGRVEKNLQKVEYYAYFYFSLICLDLNSFFSNSHLQQIERDFLSQYQHDPEATNQFYATRDRMLRFLRSKNKPALYQEFYWKFVELFFKRPIKEQTVTIAISFCYASYFIWKKEGEKIIKIMKKIKEVFLPRLRNEYNAIMRTSNEKNRCRIDCNILETVLEDAVNSKKLPSFVENKDDE